MRQTQKVATRFPIESDLETDNIKRLSDLINEVYDSVAASFDHVASVEERFALPSQAVAVRPTIGQAQGG